MTGPEAIIDRDLRAAAGDLDAARQARYLAKHPDGPQTAEEWVEASTLGLSA